MTHEEIIEKCKEQQRIANHDDASVMFLLRGKWGKRDTRRMWAGGPIGDIVGEPRQGQLAVMFRADEVIAAVEAVVDSI